MTSFKVNGLVWHQEKRLPALSCHLTAPWPSLDICFLTAIKTKTKKSQPLVLVETRSVVCMLNINSSSVEHTHISAIAHICKPFTQWKLGVGRVGGISDTVKQQYWRFWEHINLIITSTVKLILSWNWTGWIHKAYILACSYWSEWLGKVIPNQWYQYLLFIAQVLK